MLFIDLLLVAFQFRSDTIIMKQSIRDLVKKSRATGGLMSIDEINHRRN